MHENNSIRVKQGAHNCPLECILCCSGILAYCIAFHRFALHFSEFFRTAYFLIAVFSHLNSVRETNGCDKPKATNISPRNEIMNERQYINLFLELSSIPVPFMNLQEPIQCVYIVMIRVYVCDVCVLSNRRYIIPFPKSGNEIEID